MCKRCSPHATTIRSQMGHESDVEHMRNPNQLLSSTSYARRSDVLRSDVLAQEAMRSRFAPVASESHARMQRNCSEQGDCYKITVIQEAKKELERRQSSHDVHLIDFLLMNLQYRSTAGIKAYKRNTARLISGDDCKALKKQDCIDSGIRRCRCVPLSCCLRKNCPSTPS